MYRFNIPITPDEDFPEVVTAQRVGEGFKKEYVEYEPQWRFDKRRRAVVVDEKRFYAMADTSERLTAENAKLRKLARQMYPLAKACLQLGVALGCNDTMSYDWALQMTELGIEVA